MAGLRIPRSAERILPLGKGLPEDFSDRLARIRAPIRLRTVAVTSGSSRVAWRRTKAMNSRRTRLRSALAVILTVLVLVPSAVLFGRVWQENSRQTTQTDLEKKGVEYITALTPLVSALTEAQSSAIQGVTAPPDSLNAAVSKVAAADAKLGDDLKTKERWTDLNAKIAKLPKVTGGPLAVLQAHIEVSDLALALYGAVRRNSE